jgi:hypothetical protein
MAFLRLMFDVWLMIPVFAGGVPKQLAVFSGG